MRRGGRQDGRGRGARNKNSRGGGHQYFPMGLDMSREPMMHENNNQGYHPSAHFGDHHYNKQEEAKVDYNNYSRQKHEFFYDEQPESTQYRRQSDQYRGQYYENQYPCKCQSQFLFQLNKLIVIFCAYLTDKQTINLDGTNNS